MLLTHSAEKQQRDVWWDQIHLISELILRWPDSHPTWSVSLSVSPHWNKATKLSAAYHQLKISLLQKRGSRIQIILFFNLRSLLKNSPTSKFKKQDAVQHLPYQNSDIRNFTLKGQRNFSCEGRQALLNTKTNWKKLQSHYRITLNFAWKTHLQMSWTIIM